jgi:hypothetical protein
MLMWTVVTAAACLLAIWGAIDRWSGRLERQAPKRWPPVTVLSDYASLFVADDAAPTEGSRDQSAPEAIARIAAFFALNGWSGRGRSS